MVELTNEVRLLAMGFIACISFPAGFLCGWKVKKYSMLAKNESSGATSDELDRKLAELKAREEDVLPERKSS